jgi:uncharacterized protein YyaL (SSP411 family)
MAHESFENTEIARILNRAFISVKVDREEHPELDQIYMEAVQVMTGHGGWPMSVFLTPELEPFYGGTYWPPEPRGGMPGFADVLVAVAEAWKNRRTEAVRQAKHLTKLLQQAMPEGAAWLGKQSSRAPSQNRNDNRRNRQRDSRLLHRCISCLPDTLIHCWIHGATGGRGSVKVRH